MIRITENDLVLFKYLFEEDFLEREVIKKYIWENRGNSYIDNRLAQLINAGYIKKELHPTKKNAKLLAATKKAKLILSMKKEIFKDGYQKGNSILTDLDLENYKVVDGIDVRTTIHNFELIKVRLKLEKLGVDFWKSRTLLNRDREDFPLIPDGKFEYKGTRYFLEFDFNNSYRRYQKAINVYKNNLIENVIFIFKRPRITKGFKKLLTVSDDKYYFGLYSDFKENYIELETILGEMGDKLIIGSK